MEAREIDLDVPRGVGELLDTTFSLFARHAALFMGVTALVVAPVVVLVDGLWGGVLAHGPDATFPPAAYAVGGILQFAIPVLVTALHVGIVWALGSNGDLSVRVGLRAGLRRFPVAFVAVLLYTALTLVGFCLFLIPGAWIMVIGWFCAQVAVVECAGPLGAFERSVALVRGHWWWTFGALVLSWLLFALVGEAVRTVLGDLVDGGVLFIVLLTPVEVAEFSLSALFGTLLYFSLRARQAELAQPVAA